MGWEQISTGTFTRIGVGSAAVVFVIDSIGTPYRFSGDISNPWVKFPGSIHKDISAARDGSVWGVNQNGVIYRWDKKSWTSIPGTLHRISAGSRSNVWGVNTIGAIYRYTGDDSNPMPWIAFPGSLHTDIGAAEDGTVWGVNDVGVIYRWELDHWVAIPGTLAAISVGSSADVWGVDSAGSVFRYTGNDSASWPWVQMPGDKFNDIGVGADGEVWGVKKDGSVHRWNPYK